MDACQQIFTGLGVGITWFILPFFMIIPFCLDSCYEGGNQAPAQITVIQQTASPVTTAPNPIAGMQMAPDPSGIYSQQPAPVMGVTPAYAQPVEPVQPMQAVPAATVQPVMAPEPVMAADFNQSKMDGGGGGDFGASAPVVATAAAVPTAVAAISTDGLGAGGGKMEGGGGGGGGAGGASLHDFLVGCNLSQYEMQLQEMGAMEAADLRDLLEEDLVTIGMKKLEIKRLMRQVEAL